MNRPSPLALWCVLVLTLLWSFAMLAEIRGFSRAEGTAQPSCTFSSGFPILDLELASSAQCFRGILLQGGGQAQHNAVLVRMNTHMDFLFIALYSMTFILFVLGYPGPMPKVVIVLALVGAVFDCLENYRILQGVRNFLSNSPIGSATPRNFSLIKWVLLGMALLVVAKIFWEARGRWSRVHAVVALASGLLTILGLWLPYLMVGASLGFLLVIGIGLGRVFPFSWDTDTRRPFH